VGTSAGQLKEELKEREMASVGINPDAKGWDLGVPVNGKVVYIRL
jgi:hypothetical protein